MRLVIAGGGTGGIFSRALPLPRNFSARNSDNEVLFVGTERGIEARLLPKLGFRLECISASGIKGQSNLAKLKSAALLIYGYASRGGYLRISSRIWSWVSADMLQLRSFFRPAVCRSGALSMSRMPFPGITNKVLARFAEKVFISIEESKQFFPEETTMLTGNPLRKEILGNVQLERKAIGDGKLRLLVFGGSAGAHRINMAMIEALSHLEKVKGQLTITHQTGEKDHGEVKQGLQVSRI